jgi:hypothetical protein
MKTQPRAGFFYSLRAVTTRGNVRMRFTTKDEIKASQATYEPANYTSELSNFLRVDNAR